MMEPRTTGDAQSRVIDGTFLVPVVILTQAEPKKTFKVKVRSFKGPPRDWDPDAEDSEEDDLWSVTDDVIANVRYGLRSQDTIDPGVWGWIAWWQGRPFLVIAECA